MPTVTDQTTGRPTFAISIPIEESRSPVEKSNAQLAVPTETAGDALTLAHAQQTQFAKSTRFYGLLPGYLQGDLPAAHIRAVWGLTAVCSVAPGLALALNGYGMGDFEFVVGGLAGGAVAALGGSVVSNSALLGGKALLEMLTKWRTLKKEKLAFFTSESAKAATPLDKAVLGLLAERWLARLGQRQIMGCEVRRVLHGAVAAASELPEATRESAKRIVNVMDGLYDGGSLKSSFTSADVTNLISVIEALTDDERPSVAEYVHNALFKDEKPRVKIDFQSMISLQTVLMDAIDPLPPALA